MDAVTTHLIAFVVGGFTGAAGQYLGEKYTDQRRKQEARAESRSEWARIEKLMPEVIGSLRNGLKDKPLIREFVVLRARGTVMASSRPRFVFYESEVADLRTKVEMLEEVGYVTNVEPGNTTIYRITQQFFERLTS